MILKALRLGRLMALQKPVGGVRGIVSGGILRKKIYSTCLVMCSSQHAWGPSGVWVELLFKSAVISKFSGDCVFTEKQRAPRAESLVALGMFFATQ